MLVCFLLPLTCAPFYAISWLTELLINFFSATWAVSVYFAFQRPWKPFNPILGETYEMVNHQGITFLAEQVGDTNVIADIFNGDNFVNKFC